MTNRRRSATTRSVPAQTPQQLLGLAQEHIRPLIGVIDRLNEADAEDERRVISKQLTRLCFKGAEPCLRVGPCKPAPPAFNNGIRIPGLGSLAGWLLGFDGHEMAGIQGQEFGRGRLAISRQGADHEDVDEGAPLCSAKDGAQDQD